MIDQPIMMDAATTISAVNEEAMLLSGTSLGPAVHCSLRRARPLIGLISVNITAVGSTLMQKAGKWQRANHHSYKG
jgi:hypothetical protein